MYELIEIRVGFTNNVTISLKVIDCDCNFSSFVRTALENKRFTSFFSDELYKL